MRLRLEVDVLIPDDHPLTDRALSDIASAAANVASTIIGGGSRITWNRIVEDEQASMDFIMSNGRSGK